MRNLKRAGLLTIALLVGGLTGCGEKEECASDFVCGRSFSACCTDTKCYYTLGGRRYDCNGVNCDSAALALALDACAAAPSDDAKSVLLKAAAAALQSNGSIQ